MEIEPLLQRTIHLLPQPGDLTSEALRERLAENAATTREQGGRGPVFIGMLLIPPIALKVGSTSYRPAR